MEKPDLERIARGALTELGVSVGPLQVVAEATGTWSIDFGGDRTLRIKCGPGTTAQWVREQIFNQFLSR